MRSPDVVGASRPERLACLIASRNLGDIVICSGVLRELMARHYAERYVVWTRPQIAWMFEGLPQCEVICSSFPVGTTKRFGIRAWPQFLGAVSRIRRLRPSVSVDFVGDVRERMFARLIGSPRHLHIGWERQHPHSRLVRNPFGPGEPLVTVPAGVSNMYAAYGLMVQALTGRECCGPLAPTLDRQNSGRLIARIGLHPFASQACKLWPAENWRQLAEGLLGRHFEVLAFSAPEERRALEAMFSVFENRVVLVTGTLEQFTVAVATLGVLVGLDSFSVHVAHQQGVPSVTINAGAPADLWAVPTGRTLADSGGCSHYPCLNFAPCRGKSYENACVRAISPSQVLAAIEALHAGAGLYTAKSTPM